VDEVICVDAGSWGIAWCVDHEGRLRQLGVGPDARRATVDVPAAVYPVAHPCWGEDPLRDTPLRVTHADGMLTTRLVHQGSRVDVDDMVTRTVIETRDEIQPFAVRFCFEADASCGVIEAWLEIVHHETGPVLVQAYDSISPLFVGGEFGLTHFGGGGWAQEWAPTSERLTPGTKVIDSFGGIQPHLQRSPVALLALGREPVTETTGAVLGFSVGWCGNVRLAADLRLDGTLRFRAGANPVGAEYRLDPGTTLSTPKVAMVWSEAGLGDMSRRFHDWIARTGVRQPDRLRPLVINNWEATFFDFDHDRLVGLMDRAADLGGNVFLLDDGWFGTTFPRNDDDQGLGDWQENTEKLPGGLAALCEAAHKRGLDFGIWVEPEMVSPRSELYGAHPDWVIRDARQPREHRQQLALDLLRDDVFDFAAGVVDSTLAAAPGTAYVKWDANRSISDPGSTALANDRQSNLNVDLARRTDALMARVAAAHPDTVMMLCASGGGRVDHASLRHFHEVWTSDNTDPVERVVMQWGFSHVFPARTMAAHVTRMGDRPLEFACAVALSGRFGFDLDLAALDPDELRICRHAVAVARLTQPLVQFGRLHRLLSPAAADSPGAVLAYVSDQGDLAVVFAYQLQDRPTNGDQSVEIPLAGLGTSGTGPARFRAQQLRLDAGAASFDVEPVGAPLEVLTWELAGRHTAGTWLLSAVTR